MCVQSEMYEVLRVIRKQLQTVEMWMFKELTTKYVLKISLFSKLLFKIKNLIFLKLILEIT